MFSQFSVLGNGAEPGGATRPVSGQDPVVARVAEGQELGRDKASQCTAVQ